MSNNLNNKKPTIAVIQIWLVEIVFVIRNGAARKVIDWPANSSATTCPGSLLPVVAITAGANLTQMTEKIRVKMAITMEIVAADVPK